MVVVSGEFKWEHPRNSASLEHKICSEGFIRHSLCRVMGNEGQMRLRSGQGLRLCSIKLWSTEKRVKGNRSNQRMSGFGDDTIGLLNYVFHC